MQNQPWQSHWSHQLAGSTQPRNKSVGGEWPLEGTAAPGSRVSCSTQAGSQRAATCRINFMLQTLPQRFLPLRPATDRKAPIAAVIRLEQSLKTENTKWKQTHWRCRKCRVFSESVLWNASIKLFHGHQIMDMWGIKIFCWSLGSNEMPNRQQSQGTALLDDRRKFHMQKSKLRAGVENASALRKIILNRMGSAVQDWALSLSV